MWRVLFVLAALSSSTAPEQQFDLICNETMHTIRVTLGPQDADKTLSTHYRIDLKAGKWCEGACTAIHPIAEAQPGYLKLRPDDKEHGMLGNPGSFTNMIDRTTGESHMMSEEADDLLGKSLTTFEGKCEREPFSGFPNIQTKF